MKSIDAVAAASPADGLETVVGPGKQARIVVSRHGAQVLSWQVDGVERLFVSPRAQFGAGQAIRGGIPVVFPQFGTRGPGLRHGFARLRQWTTESDQLGIFQAVLRDDAATRELWPHAFEARLTARCPAGTSLQIALCVTNTGETAFSFTAALHTYLQVADIRLASLRGLHGGTFLDAVHGGARGIQDAEALTFQGEIDRIYTGTATRELVLTDARGDLRIRQHGFADTVVWNPGEALAASMPDLGLDGHRHFLCVEAACVEVPVELAPGGSWHGGQILIG